MNIEYCLNRISYFKDLKHTLTHKNNCLEEDIIKNNNSIKIISESKEIYQKVIDIVYEQSVGELKTTLNLALKYVFYDEDYEIDIEIDDKRGKSLTFNLKDNKKDMEMDVKDSVGNGIRVVVFSILHIYYLINKNSNVLFLDESYSYLSSDYVSRFFEFLNRLCDEKKFKIVMISHDERFFPYCNNVYRLVGGDAMVVTNE